jgi:hypothetical protein
MSQECQNYKIEDVTMGWITCGLSLRRGKRLFSKMNRPALEPTQLSIARVSGALPPGVK